MTLTKLLGVIGDENVMVQNLAQALDGPQRELSKPARTRLCFITDEPLSAVLSGRRIGLVVWIDRDKLKAASEQIGATHD
jgi:hypothetical protein